METVQRIQYLRALAAGIVLLSHGLIKVDRLCEMQGWTKPGLTLDGTFGVDIFFVISGFLMAATTGNEFARPGAPGRFLLRRIVRIVPLFWLFVAVEVGLRIARPDAAGTPFGLPEIVQTLLFIPYGMQDGIFRPIVGLGWTLDYEMFFYAVFAAGLLLRREFGLILVTGGLLGLVAAGQVLQPDATFFAAWTAPVLLEFLLGVGLGRLFLFARARNWHLPIRAPFLIAVAIVVAENALIPMADRDALGWRPLHWLLAALIVGLNAFAVPDRATERVFAGRVLRALGDSSYSLYLSHPVILTIVARAWMVLGFGPASLPAFFATAVAACLLAGWMIHRWVERPLLRAMLGFRAPPGSRLASPQSRAPMPARAHG